MCKAGSNKTEKVGLIKNSCKGLSLPESSAVLQTSSQLDITQNLTKI